MAEPDLTRILQPSRGFAYSWDPSRAIGDRINPASLRLDGVAIDPATTYRVTVNNFLADGGDGFTVLREGANRLGGAVDLDALAAYFAAHSPVAPGARDRIATGPYGAAAPPEDEVPSPVRGRARRRRRRCHRCHRNRRRPPPPRPVRRSHRRRPAARSPARRRPIARRRCISAARLTSVRLALPVPPREPGHDDPLPLVRARRGDGDVHAASCAGAGWSRARSSAARRPAPTRSPSAAASARGCCRPGTYALRIDAVDAAGNRARPGSLRLTVTRR